MIVLADSRSRVTGRIDCRVVGVALGHSGVNTVIRRRDVQLAVVNDNFLRLDALLATGYGERAAVHGELRLGVHALAAGFHDIGAPGHGRLHVGAQGVIGRLDLRVAAGQTQIRGRPEALIARFHGERATVDGHKPARRILVVARLHTVAAGRDGEGATGHLHAVLAAQSVLLGDHGNRAARDHEVVLGVHAMAIVAFDAQRAGAVDGQVGLRVQRRVGLVLPFRKRIARTVGQRVLCAVGQGHEYLVSLLDVQRRPRLVANRRAAKHDLHLVLATGVHHQRPGRQLSGHHIGAGGGNSHRGALHRSTFAGHRRALARQRNVCRGGDIVGSVLVAVGILEIHTGDVDKRRPVHPVSRARCAAIALGPAALSLLAFLASAFGGFLERAARAPRQRQRPRQRHSQGSTAPSPSSRHASAHHLVRLQHQFSLCRLPLWSCTTIGLISLGASRHRCSPTSARPLKNAAVKKQLPRQQQRYRDGTDSCASSSLFLLPRSEGDQARSGRRAPMPESTSRSAPRT